MTWVENQLNNENLFPWQPGVPFPKNFLSVIKVIFKRLFRVYAHIYHSHFQHIMSLGLEYHLNTCFKHFIFFIDEFKLVDDKELAPLAELIQQFKARKDLVPEGGVNNSITQGITSTANNPNANSTNITPSITSTGASGSNANASSKYN